MLSSISHHRGYQLSWGLSFQENKARLLLFLVLGHQIIPGDYLWQ